MTERDNPIKLIIFDIDDTLIYREKDPRVQEQRQKFSLLEEGVVADNPGYVQKLMPNAIQVLEQLTARGYTLALGSMGRFWQVKRFLEAFGILHYFDLEIGSYGRENKGEKVRTIIEIYNERLVNTHNPEDPIIKEKFLEPKNVLFVDDNLGYLGTVERHLPDIKVIWAHYRAFNGVLDLYRDMKEQYGIDLLRGD